MVFQCLTCARISMVDDIFCQRLTRWLSEYVENCRLVLEVAYLDLNSSILMFVTYLVVMEEYYCSCGQWFACHKDGNKRVFRAKLAVHHSLIQGFG